METVRWGIIGCGDVTEVKSGPGFQKAQGSALTAVMRRDLSKAEDYAHRHGVGRAHGTVDALIADPDVDAVYVATPPSSHCEIALQVAAARKPCLVEKPMARNHAECLRMIEAFEAARVPLWVAYYRRALPRFQFVFDRLRSGAIGQVTSVHVSVSAPLLGDRERGGWRVDPEIAGAGLFFDLGSHCFDLLDFLVGEIRDVSAFAVNTAGAYAAEDVTATAFVFDTGCAGTGIWNFNARAKSDAIVFTGTTGELETPVFSDTDVVIADANGRAAYPVGNPPHVHQPLIQTIVDELGGRGRCASTGRSAARTSWVLDRSVERYYTAPR